MEGQSQPLLDMVDEIRENAAERRRLEAETEPSLAQAAFDHITIEASSTER